MTSDPASDPAGELDGYLQRAELLAELGRYDEAVAELGFAGSLAPSDPRPSALLARVQLAAGRPAQALTAAESALAGAAGAGSRSGEPAAGGDPAGRAEVGADDSTEMASGGGDPGGGKLTILRTQVVKGFALADLRRFGEAAQVAGEILTTAPADSYAQRSGAAILAESRNGQPALNAAWRSVELDPGQAQAHLVLSLVSARLGLFDLAERAYRAALELDPQLPEAARDVGVIRLERRRYAAALEVVAESATSTPERPKRPESPSPESTAGGHPDASPYPTQPPPADGGPPRDDDLRDSEPSRPVDLPHGEPSRPVGPADGSAHRPGPSAWAATTVADGLRRLVLYGAGYAVVAAVLVACLAAGNPAQSRIAAVLAAIGGGALLWVLAARTPKLVGTILPALLRQDRALALAGYAALAGPVLILVYALVGTPWPLVLAIAGTAAAELVVLRRPLPPPRA